MASGKKKGFQFLIPSETTLSTQSEIFRVESFDPKSDLLRDALTMTCPSQEPPQRRLPLLSGVSPSIQAPIEWDLNVLLAHVVARKWGNDCTEWTKSHYLSVWSFILCTYISTCPRLEARLIFLSRECIVRIYKVSCFVHITLSSFPVLLTSSAVFLDSFCLQKARVLDEACMQSKERFVRQQESKVKGTCHQESADLEVFKSTRLSVLVFSSYRQSFSRNDCYLPRSSQPASQFILYFLCTVACARAQVKRGVHERFEHL